MTASATLVLANHRPENILLACRLMTAHDTILLEEPPDKRFEPMLDEKFAIDDYLEDQELEYPEFRRQMPIDSPCVIKCGPRRWGSSFIIRGRSTSKPGKFIVPFGTNSGGGCRPVSPYGCIFS
jgi:hypothetical protein